MSFAVDLWNSYELVSGNVMLHLRGLRDFMGMMKEKALVIKTNENGLNKINDLNYAVSTFASLYNGIMTFRSDLVNEGSYLNQFYIGITDEILKPLASLYQNLNSKANALHNEAKPIIYEYQNSLRKLDQSQLKYHKAAKKSEESKIKCESLKSNHQLSIDEQNKISLQAWDDLKLAKEAENAYMISLNHANWIRENYIEILKRVLTEYQEIEEEIGENIKDSLRKYIIYQVAYMRNMQYDIDKKAAVMENIDIKNDIQIYISKNENEHTFPYKHEYVPYEPIMYKGIATADSNSISPSKIASSVQSFISNVLLSDSIIESEVMNSETKASIDSIVKNIFNSANSEIDINQKQQINIYLSHKKNRRLLLKAINDYRTTGNYILKISSYNLLGNSLFNCLEQINQERDYQSLKIIINLSMTLYKIDNRPNMPRIFLQKGLVNHSLWNRQEIWIDLIKDSIIDELHNQKTYHIYTTEIEAKEDKKNRMEEVVKSQIESFLYHMISLEREPKLMKDIVDFFFIYYNIENNKKDSCKQIIDDFIQTSKAQDNTITITTTTTPSNQSSS